MLVSSLILESSFQSSSSWYAREGAYMKVFQLVLYYPPYVVSITAISILSLEREGKLAIILIKTTNIRTPERASNSLLRHFILNRAEEVPLFNSLPYRDGKRKQLRLWRMSTDINVDSWGEGLVWGFWWKWRISWSVSMKLEVLVVIARVRWLKQE